MLYEMPSFDLARSLLEKVEVSRVVLLDIGDWILELHGRWSGRGRSRDVTE